MKEGEGGRGKGATTNLHSRFPVLTILIVSMILETASISVGSMGNFDRTMLAVRSNSWTRILRWAMDICTAASRLSTCWYSIATELRTLPDFCYWC